MACIKYIMDLNAINIFVQVVNYHSFTDAATVLNMTKSTVSRKVGELEQHLGVRLITRSTRSLVLTPEGERFYQSGVQMLDMMNQAEIEVSANQSLVKGPLNIVMPFEIGHQILEIILSNFLHEYPEVTINLELSNRSVDLIAEGVDLYVQIGDPSDSSLVSRYATSSKRILVASPEYLQRFGTISSHLDLSPPHRMVELYSKTADIPRNPLLLNNKPFAIDIPTILKVNTITACLLACIKGLGIAALPEYHCKQYIEEETLIRLLPDYVTPEVSVNLLYIERKLMPKRKKLLIDYLVRAFEKHNKNQL